MFCLRTGGFGDNEDVANDCDDGTLFRCGAPTVSADECVSGGPRNCCGCCRGCSCVESPFGGVFEYSTFEIFDGGCSVAEPHVTALLCPLGPCSLHGSRRFRLVTPRSGPAPLRTAVITVKDSAWVFAGTTMPFGDRCCELSGKTLEGSLLPKPPLHTVRATR